MIFLDPDDKESPSVETTGKALPNCLYDPAEEDQSTFISKAAAAELYTSLYQHTAGQKSETQD